MRLGAIRRCDAKRCRAISVIEIEKFKYRYLCIDHYIMYLDLIKEPELIDKLWAEIAKNDFNNRFGEKKDAKTEI